MLSHSATTANPLDLLPRSCALLREGKQVGLHVGAQVYISQGGQALADFGWGEARPGVAMTADTVMLWLSAGKPVGAVAILQLVERGLLTLDDPVAMHIPEFAAQGKDTITIRHILTHTGGFRWVDIGWPESSWDQIIAKICAAKPERDWVPGARAGYHAFTSWYILGELVRRVDGRTYSDYVRQAIFLPCQMDDSWIGISQERSRGYGDRWGVMLHLDKPEPVSHRYDTPAGASTCVPGGNGHGPMHDLGRFYEMLLASGVSHGTRIVSAEHVRLMTTPRRVGMLDETFRHTLDWGWGLIIDSKHYGGETVPYGYGRYASPRTFGHGGSQSSVGFADPDRQLVVAVVFNGMPGERKHELRIHGFLDAVYQDLGLDQPIR